MATHSYLERPVSNTPCIESEPLEYRLAVRRNVHKTSLRFIATILDALDLYKHPIDTPVPHVDRRGKLKNKRHPSVLSKRGFLYASHCVTLIPTQELPYGKKHRTADIVRSIPSTSENMLVNMGGFVVARRGTDSPKLGIEVSSPKLQTELESLHTAFASKGLDLRGNIVNPSSPTHIAIAEIKKDAEPFFTVGFLDELTIVAGGTISKAGAHLGSITLNAVSVPRKCD